MDRFNWGLEKDGVNTVYLAQEENAWISNDGQFGNMD